MKKLRPLCPHCLERPTWRVEAILNVRVCGVCGAEVAIARRTSTKRQALETTLASLLNEARS